MAVVVVTGFLMLCALAVLVPGPIFLKAAVIAALLAVFVFLYWGWSLYTTRALEAGRRVRAHLERQRAQANIVPFARSRTRLAGSHARDSHDA
jgi:hypothetical protein